MNLAHALMYCCGVNETYQLQRAETCFCRWHAAAIFAGKHTTLCTTSRDPPADAQAKKPVDVVVVNLHLNKRLTLIVTSVTDSKGLASC